MARHIGLTDDDKQNPQVAAALKAQKRVDDLEKKLREAHQQRDEAVTVATGPGSSRGLVQRLADHWGLTRRGIDDMKRRAKERREQPDACGTPQPPAE